MIPASKNSKWMVRFPLRRDFAWETGFVDCVRAPMSRSRYQHLAAQFRAAGRIPKPYDRVCAEAEAYQPPRYMGYLYSIPPGAREATPLITDGQREFFLPHNGLWTTLDERINRTLYLRPDRWPVIKPATRREDAIERVRPLRFVLHDTQRGEAGLYLWSDRFDYLLAFPHAPRIG